MNFILNLLMNFVKYFSNYFSKPFYENEYFIKWVQNSNVLIILRGPYRTKNQSLSNKLKNIGNFELIHKVGDDGDSAELCAIDYLVDSVKNCIESHRKLMIVSLESMSLEDVKPFLALAKEHFYMTIIPDHMNHWRDDLKEAQMELQHCSKHQNIETEVDKFQKIPVYFAGWFMSDNDQECLHKIGRECLLEMWRNDSLRHQLEVETGISNVDEFWPQQKQRLHVTSKFVGNDSNKQYLEEVSGALYRVSSMSIQGLLLTPRTFSCHVVLTSKDASLFGDQELKMLKPHITLAVGGSHKPVESGSDQVEVQTLRVSGVVPKSSFKTSRGEVHDYGECRFYLSLNKGYLTYCNLFNFFY